MSVRIINNSISNCKKGISISGGTGGQIIGNLITDCGIGVEIKPKFAIPTILLDAIFEDAECGATAQTLIHKYGFETLRFKLNLAMELPQYGNISMNGVKLIDALNQIFRS